MSDRFASMSIAELESGLADLATALAFPVTPDLATTVGTRLRAGAGIAARPRLHLLPARRTVRRSLLLAAALVLLVVGAAVAVRFGLDLLSIEFGPVPTVSPSPLAPGAQGEYLQLGERVDLADAEAAAPFDILVPNELGQPDVVYLGGVTVRGQVAFVYLPRDGLPASSLLHGAAILITQNRGTQDEGLAHKLVDLELVTLDSVAVDGAPGVWISGEPHFFWYKAPDGEIIDESERLVGDTLVWERDGILYRIEGAISVERALEIARSMR